MIKLINISYMCFFFIYKSNAHVKFLFSNKRNKNNVDGIDCSFSLVSLC